VKRTDESTDADAGYGITETAGAACARSSMAGRPPARRSAARRSARRVVMVCMG
jgi:hypothetical protein